jgi:hypothetical protein
MGQFEQSEVRVMATPTPYKAKQRGDLIQAEDWNDIQIQSRVEIQSHDHSGDVNGKKIKYHNLDDIPTTFPLAVNSVTSSHMTAAAINTTHLQDQAVTAAKIAAAAITNTHVAPEAAIAESKVTFGEAGHDHDGTNGKKISYHNLDDIPTTFPPVAHQHHGEELTIDNLRIGGNLQVERSGFFTGNVGIGVPAPTEKLEVAGIVKATEFVKHDGTPIGSKWIDGTGGIHYDTGKVGIGTPAPREALEVHGNIRLGQGGSFYALAALHNLRVIVGKVHDDGSKAWGDGFQSRRTETGRYCVDFDEHFAGVPVVIAGCTDTDPDQKETVGCHGVSASGFDVRLWRNAGNRWEDDPFDFIAFGPK